MATALNLCQVQNTLSCINNLFDKLWNWNLEGFFVGVGGGGRVPRKNSRVAGKRRNPNLKLPQLSSTLGYKLRPFMTIELLIPPFFPKYSGTLI